MDFPRVPGETSGLYIGDGVYATFDGWHIWLRTYRGGERWDEVALEPEVFDALVSYRSQVMKLSAGRNT